MTPFSSIFQTIPSLVFGLILGSAICVSQAVAFQNCDDWSRIASPNFGTDATFARGISGTADDDVWSVGWFRIPASSGQTDLQPFSIHWDGQQWDPVSVPVPPHGFSNKAVFLDVTAIARDDAWAVGDYIPPDGVNTVETLAMHWNGSDWNLVDSPTARIGSGSGFRATDARSGELWAVGFSTGAGGSDNLAARWNGSGWDAYYPVRINTGDHELTSVDILSANEVWAVGAIGPLGLPYVTRWNGSSWNEIEPRIDSDLYLGLSSVIVFAPDNVWVGATRVDENRQRLYFVYLHFDGSGWTETQTVSEYHIPHFEGTDPNNFYSAGFGTLAHFDGNQWSLVDSLAVDVWTIGDTTVLPSGTVWGTGNTYDTGTPLTLTARWTPCPTGPRVIIPETLEATAGVLVSGGVIEIAESDDLDVAVRRRGADVQSRAWFEVTATSQTETPSELEVTLEGSVFARSTVNQSIELFDYVAGAFELIDSRTTMRFTDSTVTVGATGDLSRFVQPGTREMKARVKYDSVNPRQQFTSNSDQFIWSVQN